MSGNCHAAEQLKQQGNAHFKQQDYTQAAALYSLAIQQHPTNPLLYTNRANARLKLHDWQSAMDDCLRSIDLLPHNNMKAHFYLAHAQLELHRPHEALASALTAYTLCTAAPAQPASAFAIAALVLRCKREKWAARERQRLRLRGELLAELLDGLDAARAREEGAIAGAAARREMGAVEARERRGEARDRWRAKEDEVRAVFAVAEPARCEKRAVPDYLVDDISFEIMHDPVVTKNGHSYERATIVEHLRRNPVDPLTREPLLVKELRPNLALKQACDDFWERNSGWAYDW